MNKESSVALDEENFNNETSSVAMTTSTITSFNDSTSTTTTEAASKSTSTSTTSTTNITQHFKPSTADTTSTTASHKHSTTAMLPSTSSTSIATIISAVTKGTSSATIDHHLQQHSDGLLNNQNIMLHHNNSIHNNYSDFTSANTTNNIIVGRSAHDVDLWNSAIDSNSSLDNMFNYNYSSSPLLHNDSNWLNVSVLPTSSALVYEDRWIVHLALGLATGSALFIVLFTILVVWIRRKRDTVSAGNSQKLSSQKFQLPSLHDNFWDDISLNYIDNPQLQINDDGYELASIDNDSYLNSLDQLMFRSSRTSLHSSTPMNSFASYATIANNNNNSNSHSPRPNSLIVTNSMRYSAPTTPANGHLSLTSGV